MLLVLHIDHGVVETMMKVLVMHENLLQLISRIGYEIASMGHDQATTYRKSGHITALKYLQMHPISDYLANINVLTRTSLEYILKCISSWINDTRDPNVMYYFNVHIDTVWWITMEALVEVVRVRFLNALDIHDIWSTFGEDIKLKDESFFMSKVGQARLGRVSQLIGRNRGLGCSWHRCVTYQFTPRTDRFILYEVNGCRTVQYCSCESLPNFRT